MAETTLDKVRRIVATQSEGYLISPGATAFVVEDLSVEDVTKALAQLENDGHVRLDEVVAQRQQPKLDDDGEPIADEFATDPITGDIILEDILDENNKPVLVDEGWCITDQGREAHRNG